MGKADAAGATRVFSESEKWLRALGHITGDLFTMFIWEFPGIMIEGLWRGEPLRIKVNYDRNDDVQTVEVLEGEKVVAKTVHKE